MCVTNRGRRWRTTAAPASSAATAAGRSGVSWTGSPGRWTLLVVATLDGEPLRFTELQQRIPGISQRMLTRTVRQLERDGLITRTVFPQVPPRVEYELTPLGRTLIRPAVLLAEWAVDHNPDIELSRAGYDAKHP